MEVIIPEMNVMSIESVIFKDGANFQADLTTSEFLTENEFVNA